LGFRFYKSVSVGKGVRLGVSKSGLGVSAGVPGARYSVHSSGRTRKSAGIPGSGLRYDSQGSLKKGQSRSPQRSAAQAEPVAAALPQLKAPLLAPKSEKSYVKGLNAFLRQEFSGALGFFREAATLDRAAVSAWLFAGVCSNNVGDGENAITWFEGVVQADAPLPDALMIKYVPPGAFQTSLLITPSVTVEVPFDSLGAALILAECYQNSGNSEKAIGMVENLVGLVPESPPLCLSLAELYHESEMWEELATMPTKIENKDDLSAEVLRYKARGLRERGLYEGALELLREALKSKKRHPDILKAVRYERGITYEAMGKKPQARKDFERLFAEDSSYKDVRQRVERLLHKE
jgi:tetratricopeptide (TPR) repeat protein